MGHDAAEEFWQQIESLGGNGVWEREMFTVSFEDSDLQDDDLALFRDFPSPAPEAVMLFFDDNTRLTDACLDHLDGLENLENLGLMNTSISEEAIERFRETNPGVVVTTKPPGPDTINPFTGEPVGDNPFG